MTDDWKQESDVCAAHNIFFGQVIRESGNTKQDGGAPQTQYEVEVLETLKGDLSGRVTVNQEAGFYDDGMEHHVEDEDYFLEAGKSYFFATRTSSRHGWHTVVPHYGDVKLDVADSSTKAEVMGSASAAEYKGRFTEAVKNAIPIPWTEGSAAAPA